MAPYGIQISKQITFRGVSELFANIYHYDTGAIIDTDSGWDSLIDQIVAIEKTVYGSAVAYKEGRVFGPTNQGVAANQMRRVKDLTGNGTLVGGGNLFAEAAVVCSFYIGRNPATGRKRFLRKFYRSQLLPSSSGGDVLGGRLPLTAADKLPYTTAMNNLKTITVGASANDLCTPQGDHLPLGSSPTILDFVHSRQLKQ